MVILLPSETSTFCYFTASMLLVVGCNKVKIQSLVRAWLTLQFSSLEGRQLPVLCEEKMFWTSNSDGTVYKPRTRQMSTYQFSLKALPAARSQGCTMVALKFAAVICLLYFTIFVNAGKKQPTCKTVLTKLNKMESLCKGTFRNVFYLCIKRFKSVVFGRWRYLNSEQQFNFMIRCRIWQVWWERCLYSH